MDNKNIQDVIELVGKNLEKPIKEDMRKATVSLLSQASPMMGGVAQAVMPFLTEFDKFKLYWFLMGYSNGLDVERKINELYLYAQEPERAFLLGNTLKKIFSSETIKACVLQGMILSEHVTENKNYERDELIICKALENATDIDLDCFKYIMENFIIYENGIKEVIINKSDPNASDCEITQNWCIYNRIFLANMQSYFTFKCKGQGMLNPPTYVGSAAEKLYELIKKGQQIWDYK